MKRLTVQFIKSGDKIENAERLSEIRKNYHKKFDKVKETSFLFISY
jgi:hypothetical protein